MQPDVFDFEIGVPVAATVKQEGRVAPSEWPALRMVRTIYRGPFEGLPAAWGEFDKWNKANGHETDGSVWERYITDPSQEADSSKYETELMRPLVG
jgi:effector-binding domain-containing protein